MANLQAKALLGMMERNRGDFRRIEHSIKVYGYAKLLGELEGLDPSDLLVLELTAALHDIGISVSEALYGYSDGKTQEKEGPPVARKILEAAGAEPVVVDRVCHIISLHHTFTAIDGIDFQLLVEADFLVNAIEDKVSPEGIVKFVRANFKSGSGLKLISELTGASGDHLAS